MANRAFIYTGGETAMDKITEMPSPHDIVIAADSGFNLAVSMGEHVDVLIGDMDSIGFDPDKLGMAKHAPSKIIRAKREKSETDTMLAVKTALEMGYESIVIIGGLGRRQDHSMSNLFLLEWLCDQNIKAIIVNGFNRARVLKDTSELISYDGYQNLSLLSLSEVCDGVSVKGVKYPLNNAKLFRKWPYAVSNVLKEQIALVEVKKGTLLVMESSD